MSFQNNKKNTLLKIDKSKKGSVDKEIKELIKFINSHSNYYTTSSCSGRIMLIGKNSYKKHDNIFIFQSHKNITLKEIRPSIKILPSYPIWFKQEPAILHICCKTIEDAQRLVDIARFCGFKRTGIQSTRKKINVEIGSSEFIDTIISDNEELLITEEYLNVLIIEANKKMDANNNKLIKFYKEIKKLFKN